METLILARHGESQYSAHGLLNGDDTVDVGLTEKGREQAAALGRSLEETDIDLCVTTGLRRTRQTAEVALAGRDVPYETWPDLNDPRVGSYEGRHVDDYRVWAFAAGSGERAPGEGESRIEVVTRYARAYRALLDRPERTILALVHALPIAYVLGAVEGRPPAARMDGGVEHAFAHRLDAAELERVVTVLEQWSAAPTW